MNEPIVGYAVGYMSRNSDEWHQAWAKLVNLTGGDKAENDPERWQYLHTVTNSGKWWHEFKHSAIPGAGRCYVGVEATRGYKPETDPDEDIF